MISANWGVAAFALVAVPLPAFAATAMPSDMRELAIEQHVPVVSWAVVRDGRVSGATEILSRGRRQPAGRDYFFHAASVTKPVVATGVLLLVRDGRLSLNMPVATLLPELRVKDARWAKVTVEQLLSHTSGLGDVSTGLGEHVADSWSEARTYLEIPDRIAFDGDPDAAYSYSNLNYLLLGRIVENVSGRTLGEFMTATALAPNGARGARLSCFDISPRAVAAPHTLDGRGEVVESEFKHLGRMHAASSGLCITARELAIWADKILDCDRDGAVMTCAAIADALRPRKENYALGWEKGALSGVDVYGHGGSDAGYASALLTAPDKKTTVSVLTNMTFASASEMARMLLAHEIGVAHSAIVPARSMWRQFDGYYVSKDAGCARVEETATGLFFVRQRLNFPFEQTRARLIPKPEWDEGYFVSVYEKSPVWFGGAPRGGLKDPAAMSIYLDDRRFNKTAKPDVDCPDIADNDRQN